MWVLGILVGIAVAILLAAAVAGARDIPDPDQVANARRVEEVTAGSPSNPPLGVEDLVAIAVGALMLVFLVAVVAFYVFFYFYLSAQQ